MAVAKRFKITPQRLARNRVIALKRAEADRYVPPAAEERRKARNLRKAERRALRAA